jgi:PmbA protein
MKSEKELLELCKYIVKKARKSGANDAEALAVNTAELESEVEMAQVSTVNQKKATEIAIRLYVGRKMGSAFLNIATKEAADEAVELAIAAAEATTPDEDWIGLPEPSEYPNIENLWSSDAKDARPESIVNMLADAVAKSASAEEGLIPAFGGAGTNALITAYVNSNGVEHSGRLTVSYCVIGAIARTGSGVTPMTLSFDIARNMDVDINRIVDEVSSEIRILKNSAEGKTGTHTVVMHPRAYGQIFQYTLVQAIRGDNVARGKSKIGDKIGEKIAVDFLTITDDGTDIRGLNASEADDEGVPRQRTPIIADGVLKSFIWDTYWANKMGVKSTGNASRNMRQGLVEISPSNIIIEPGERDIDEIMSEIDHGYLITGVQGAHSSNPESGDFSVVGNPAILIENGEPVGAVHGLMVSGNVFDLLKQVKEVAKEPHLLQSLIAPEIVFEDVDIVAKE